MTMANMAAPALPPSILHPKKKTGTKASRSHAPRSPMRWNPRPGRCSAGTPPASTPIPAKGSTRLSYTLGRSAGVQVSVHDLASRQLFTNATTGSLPGHHVQDIDISRFGKGIFLMELLVDGRRHVYKVVNN